MPVGRFSRPIGLVSTRSCGKILEFAGCGFLGYFLFKAAIFGLVLGQCSTGTSFLNMFQLGLDPFIFFSDLKFKLIDFEKTKFKFIDFKKTKFMFIDFEETKFKFKFIDFEKTKFKFIDFEKTKVKFKFMKNL